MINFLKWFSLIFLIMTLWLIVNVISTNQGWFVNHIAPQGNNVEFSKAIKKSISEKSKGNAVMLMVEKGNVITKYAISKGKPVDEHTVFGVASVGKWVAAVGIMKLVEQGKLDLDKPVSNYLTRWKLPPSSFNNDNVTIRRLLSHTAGITDGLGHNGFESADKVQPLVEHLTLAKDADEDVNGKVAVGIEPGSEFKYSGGSYNLLQLIVEEVTASSFEGYMSKAIFKPLDMKNTTYKHDQATQLAEYFDESGDIRTYPYYTSLAATGLYTTASDLLKFIAIYFPEHIQKPHTTKILTQQSLKEMRSPQASSMGINIWGLGAMLFSSNNNDDYIIGHGGQSPALNATARINPSNGNAFILLETGNRSLAADSATMWTLWETGNPDIYMLKNMIPIMLKRVLIGCVLILIGSLMLIWKTRRKNAK
jgi:CubicO group peptidase (beta-lactamase class C family)